MTATIPDPSMVAIHGVYVRREELCRECQEDMRCGLVTFSCACTAPMCLRCIEALPVPVALREAGARLGDDDWRSTSECESCERERREEAERDWQQDSGTWGRS